MKKAYLFIENNDWEGEIWNVYFEVGKKDSYKIDYIMKFIEFVNNAFNGKYKMPYQLHNTLDNSLPTLGDDIKDDDYDDDYEYYYSSYYPSESIRDIDMALVNELYENLVDMNRDYKINIENNPNVNQDSVISVLEEIDRMCYKLNLFF